MEGSSSSKRKRADSTSKSEEETNGVDWYNDSGGFFDDEFEPHVFGNSVLPVANLPSSYDSIPQNGMEYLFTVRREERRLPLVTRVPNPYAVPEKPRLDSQKSREVESSAGAIPSEEWRTCFEERFRNLRTNLRQTTIHVSLPSASGCPEVPDMRDRDRWWAFIRGDVEWENVPGSQSHAKGAKKKKQNQQPVDYEESFSQGKMHSWVVYEEKLSWDHPEEDGVIALSYGGEDTQPEGMEEEGEDGKVLDRNFSFRAGKETSGEDVLPTPSESPRPAPGIKSRSATPDDGFSPREPTHELLSLLDQTTTFHLLKYFSQWIKGRLDHSFLPPPPPPPQTHPVPQGSAKHVYDFTPCHGRWIFALLCHLDEQLTSDQISLLRNLARDAMQLIKEERSLQKTASLNKASCVGEIACWMIVGAVTGGWGQKDLWIDAADLFQ